MRVQAALAFVLLGAATAAAQPAEKVEGEVQAVLELSREFYYAGDPLQIRISIGFEGPESIANPVKTPILKGFEVREVGAGPLEATGKPSVTEPERPDRLSPMGFYGAVVDLTEIFPRLRTAGRYEIGWSGDGVDSRRLTVQIIPKYDPGKDYVANILTQEGTITIEFFPDAAPIAVKAFIDMANAAFYDGLLFHEVRTDQYIVGGDPGLSEVDRRPIVFPAEQTKLPVVAGTVILKPVGAAPPANSSPFMIVLAPQPAWAGQVTVLGQVIRGLDIAQRISRRPSNLESARPFYKPLKDIRILQIKIEEKPVASAAAADSGN